MGVGITHLLAKVQAGSVSSVDCRWYFPSFVDYFSPRRAKNNLHRVRNPFTHHMRWGLKEVQLTRAHERLGATLHGELAVDIVDVALDRADSNDQRIGD